MRQTLQIISWIGIVVGALAILGNNGDNYAVIGGGLFFAQGLFALLYINETDKVKAE